MNVIWTPRAAADLDEAFDYIEIDSPESAIRVADRIYRQVMELADMPHIGRRGDVPGTRELVLHPWSSYIAVYKVDGDTIRIIRIRHAAQNWP
jgi:toxin ParE1/3/4